MSTTKYTARNEYFVPGQGISREVITVDIRRYLGSDAMVRPGNYQNPSTGESVPGYFVTANRDMTSAMIEDLRADSARWEETRKMGSSSSEYYGSLGHFSESNEASLGPVIEPDYDPYNMVAGENAPGKKTYENLPIIDHLVPSKKDLPMILNGQPCRTNADFGASANIIDAKFAKSIGLRIDKKAQCPSFQLPIKGRRIVPVGRVLVPCMFPGEPESLSDQPFFAIKNFVFDAIMGRRFLRDTKTLELHPHRLQDRPIHVQRVPVVALLGDVEENLRFWLDGEELPSTPDTGAEINAMSYSFAKSRFNIEPDDMNQVRFADGSLSDVEGCVSVPVSFGNGEPPLLLLKLVNASAHSFSSTYLHTADATGRIEYGKTASILAEFYVVRDLRVDIIFGEDLLATVNAFVRHSTDFDEIESANGLGSIGLVQKTGRFLAKTFGKIHQQQIDPAWELDKADSQENDRYYQEQDRIETLKGQAKTYAQWRNNDQRREYNEVRRPDLVSALGTRKSRR